MPLPKYKEVNFPITVPEGNYCWEWTGEHAVCEHFSNEGGHPKCDFNFWPLEDAEEKGVKKPERCRKLVEVE